MDRHEKDRLRVDTTKDYTIFAGIANKNSERTNIEEVVAKEPAFTKEINEVVKILKGKNLEDISFIMRRVLEYAKVNAKL